jgi:thiol-disulfide isomerase/thioredoxin
MGFGFDRPRRANESTRHPATLERDSKMNRRQLLTALAGAGLTGGAAYVAVNGLGTDTERVTIDTIEARGSTAGELQVPVPGQPTLVDLFATWCVPCVAQMRRLVPVYETFGDDVAFVSVTNERFGGGLSETDIREWWADHDGRWTVGHDPESRLLNSLGAGGLPFLAFADATGEVVWTHQGVASESQLRAELEAVV